MPKLLDNRFTCGDRKIRDLSGRIQHYKNCTHPVCQSKGDRLISSLTKGNFLTLREQIADMAIRWIGKEYRDHMAGNYPGMTNYLILHAFDNNLDLLNSPTEIRALHRARSLAAQGGWREKEPAVE